jgi:hypothetical protein
VPFNQYRNREIARLTCLRAFAGRDSIASAVFDASTLVADANGRYFIPIGSFLTQSLTDPTKVCIYAGTGTNTNAVQTLTSTGTPTGGTWTATWNGQTTAPIAYNASAAAALTALTALSNIGTSVNLATGGGALPTAVTVTFQGELGNQVIPLMTTNSTGLTGGTTPAITPTTTTPGSTAQAIIGVYDGPQTDFLNNTTGADEPIPYYFHACDFDISKLPAWVQYGVAAKAALTTCTFR